MAVPSDSRSEPEILSGRRAAVFSHSIGKTHSNYTVTWCCWSKGRKGRLKVPEQVRTAYRGELSLDPETSAVLRVTRRAEPPGSFPNHRTDTMVEYQPVEVGEISFLYPGANR